MHAPLARYAKAFETDNLEAAIQAYPNMPDALRNQLRKFFDRCRPHSRRPDLRIGDHERRQIGAPIHRATAFHQRRHANRPRRVELSRRVGEARRKMGDRRAAAGVTGRVVTARRFTDASRYESEALLRPRRGSCCRSRCPIHRRAASLPRREPQPASSRRRRSG